MPKTVQIRDIDDDTYVVLSRRAARDGMSVPELLRREATRLARRPDTLEWLDRVARFPRSGISTAENLAALDAVRGRTDDDRR